MRCLPSHLCGRDVDDVFAYPTTQFARIKDARLGLFKHSMVLGVCLYIGIYQLGMEGGYLETSTVTGSTRFSLQQPTKDDCSPDDPGCSARCKNAFNSVYDLPYCNQSDATYRGSKYECEFFENIGAQIVSNGALMVLTRQKAMDEATDTRTRYVVDAELYTVLVDHSVVADDSFDIQGTSGKLDGKLLSHSHSLCERYEGMDAAQGGRRTNVSPCYIKPNTTSTNLDYFSLGVLLEAAASGSLDRLNYGGETYRETGAQMLLKINYDNFRGWHGAGPLTYVYEPSLVSGSTYKAYDVVYSDYRAARTVLDKHGIYIQAVLGGSVRQFSFLNLLIVMTTSLTLLAVATVITDFAALYVMPDKVAYATYKYTDTPDFSDLREAREGDAGALLDDPNDERKSGDPQGPGLRLA